MLDISILGRTLLCGFVYWFMNYILGYEFTLINGSWEGFGFIFMLLVFKEGLCFLERLEKEDG